MTPAAPGRFTGRHMAAILAGFFAVVVAVNLTMARFATSSFGGRVVDNSYVASQHFNRWLDEAEAGRALGWRTAMARQADGRVTVTLAGPRHLPATLAATARHPLGRMPDRALLLTGDGAGRYVSREGLPAERWRLRIEVRADGQVWRGEGDVR
jgi:nitrogen fixation protein FixH